MMRNRSWLAGLASKIFPRRFAAARRASRRRPTHSLRSFSDAPLATETLEPRHLLSGVSLVSVDMLAQGNEADGSPTDMDELTITVNVTNVAPTGVVLVNEVASLPEDTDTSSAVKVADIVITDDGVGTNTISLSGTDAASFEVDGTELFLAAGTSLDYETKSSFDVTVSVEDSSVSGSTPVTANMTLSVTDTPATVAVAVTEQGNESDNSSSIFTLTRAGDTSGTLAVNLLLLGSAKAGVDYTAPAGLGVDNTLAVSFADGESTTTIDLHTLSDAVIDPLESIQAILQPGTGYSIAPAQDRGTVYLGAEGVAVELGMLDSANSSSGVKADDGFTPGASQAANIGAFTALNADGTVSAWGEMVWGYGEINAPTEGGFTQVVPNAYAFAGLKEDGSIVCWGRSGRGGGGAPAEVAAPVDSGYVALYSNEAAFAALKSDGSLTIWGHAGCAAGQTPSNNQSFVRVVANALDFTAIRSDGTLWSSLSGAPQDGGYTQVTANKDAFTAMKADGTLVLWGESTRGDGLPVDTGYERIYSNPYASAALKTDGTIASWGYDGYGGSGAAPAGTGYTTIVPGHYAFSALNGDGTVASWGSNVYGGTGAPVDNGYVQLIGSERAFAALNEDGTVQSWGDGSYGGSGAPVDGGYVHLFSAGSAFVAMKADGSLTAWGSASKGGSGAPVDSGYVQVYGNTYAFVAMKADGSLTAWGDGTYGGSGAPAGTGFVDLAMPKPQFLLSATNEAPTGVALANTVSSLPEDTDTTSAVKVADIQVTDDGHADSSNAISLSGSDAASFSVVGTELFLAAGTPLDYETKTSYAVTVSVEDISVAGSTPVTVDYALAITDVNEAPTGVAIGNTVSSLPEDTDTSSAVKLADIQITDDALGTNAISLSGSDAASFEVVGTELFLAAGTVFDYETKSSYDATVSVEDSSVVGSTPVTVNYTLSITDVNELPTEVALENAVSYLPEDTDTSSAVKVGDIQISDDALGTNVISLTGTDAASFEVDGTELFLAAGTVLDYETKSSYDVTVSVADSSVAGSTPLTVDYSLLIDDVAGTVSIAATQQGSEADGTPTIFTLTRGLFELNQAVDVNLIFQGTAQPNVDYTAPAGLGVNNTLTVSFDAGVDVATVSLPTLSDSVIDSYESVLAILQPGVGYVPQAAADRAHAIITADGIEATPKSAHTSEQSQRSFNEFSNPGAFAALKADGSITSWGDGQFGGYDAPTDNGYVQIFSNGGEYGGAFAALKADGSITSWGDGQFGGYDAPTDNGYVQIFSNGGEWGGAFAALKADGSITSWGDYYSGGAYPDGSSLAPTDNGYVQIFSNGGEWGGAFAALKADGSITSWGDRQHGGADYDGSSLAPTDNGYVQIFSNARAFAALKADGSITSWGDGQFGGYDAPTDNGYVQIFSNGGAFAALKADGSITSWGDYQYGGADYGFSLAPTDNGYVQIFSNGGEYGGAFAALKADGSITSWGDRQHGGADYGFSLAPTDNGYVQIFSNGGEWGGAFAALKADGSITSWGDYYSGGAYPDGSSLAPTDNGYVQIFSNARAFAALKADGSITSWGNYQYGGADYGFSLAPTDNGYVQIFSNGGEWGGAFAALKADGSITSWGDYYSGGAYPDGTTLAPTDNGYVGFANPFTHDVLSPTFTPVITLVGESPYFVEASSTGDYSDPGATASDEEDGDLTDSIVVSGDVVDLSTTGGYVLRYDVQDSDGNDAETVTRAVWVQDTLAPVISLVGDTVVSVTVDPSGTYSDVGATAVDSLDGDLTGSIVVGGDVVDLAQEGSYTLTYNVADNAGNAADQVIRTVHVVDPLTFGLVAHYPFTGNADDQSSSGNHGVVYGAQLTADRLGNPSAAYQFNGSSDFIEIEDNPAVSGLDAITISAWVKWNDVSGWQSVVGKYKNDFSGESEYVLQTFDGTTVRFALMDNSGQDITRVLHDAQFNFVADRWYHFLGTYDGSDSNGVSLYIDGNAVATTITAGSITGPLEDSPYNLLIGARSQPGNGNAQHQYVHGAIDDVRIYQRALSAYDANLLYEFEPNESPTGVALVNAVSSLPEDTDTSGMVKLADIEVSDDAVGSNTISLSGTDAASFEVDGTELFLAAGTIIDYETKSSYDVTISVEDSSVTGSTPVTVDYTLLIDNVNESPVLTPGASATLGEVAEDAGPPSGAVGALVSSLIETGGVLDNFFDEDGDAAGIAIVDTAPQGGALWFSLDDGASWSEVGAVSEAAARVLYADAATRLYYEPAADFNGTLGDVLTLKAWDRTGGAANGEGGLDTGLTPARNQLGSDIDGEAAGDYSGGSVSLSSDGTTVAIGATGNDGNGDSSGHTRVFHWDGAAWSQRGSDIDGEANGDGSGGAVSLSSDGTTVAIGALDNDGNGDSSGHVRVYRWTGSAWNQLGADINGEAAGDSLGISVSMSAEGQTVAIGASSNNGSNGGLSGHTRVFHWDGSAWNQLGSDIDGEAAGDYSGSSVSLSSDGTTVAIGAKWNDGNGNIAGHTRVFHWNGSAWSQLGSDIDGEAAGDFSGVSVSLSSDGTTLAIGSYYNDGNGDNSGHTRVFTWDGSAWNQRGSDIDGEAAGDYSGSSVSLSSDGTTLAIGSRHNDGIGDRSGHTRIFTWDGAAWNQRGSDIDGEAARDYSGNSVSLSSDGTTVAIGATGNDGNGENPGHTRVFQYSTGVGHDSFSTATDTVSVSVTPVNDPPSITSPAAVNAAENSTTVATVAAIDIDTGDSIGFAITGGDDGGLFKIYSASGVLRFLAAPDFETPASTAGSNVYQVEVSATDNGGLSAVQLLSITVTDVNDAPSSVALANPTTSLPEYTDTALRVKVADVVITDDGEGTNTIGLSGIDAASFEVEGTELYLSAGAVLDYETKGSYDVTISVEDSSLAGSTPVTADYTLLIGDVDEYDFGDAPVPYPVTLAEDGARHGDSGLPFWSQVGIDIDGNPNDFLGSAVSISGDGNTIAVSDEGDAGGMFGETTFGKIQIFRWNGGAWQKLGENLDGSAGELAFRDASQVALSKDGNIILIGSPQISGAGINARIYEWSGQAWIQRGGNVTAESYGDSYRCSVAISDDGSVVAIGAPRNDGNGANSGHTRVFHWDGAAWNQRGSDIDGEAAGDQSGYSVSLSSDGTTVAIGSLHNDGNGDSSGHTRVFHWDGSTWNQLGSDINGEAAGDRSGCSVSLGSDGTTVAIGATSNDGNGDNSGHTRVFHWDGSAWNQRGSDINGEAAGDSSGHSVSLGDNGEVVAVGSPGTSETRIYQWDGFAWNALSDAIYGEGSFDNSGHSIALSDDGRVVVIGAPYNHADSSQVFSGTSGHTRVYNLQFHESRRLLGFTKDLEFGANSADADSDGADEDGIVVGELLIGNTASVDVTVSGASGFLDAWLDLNADGDWNDAGEQIFVSEAVGTGVNNLSFVVPADATTGTTFARFRLSSTGGLNVTGLAADGEVEDYAVTVNAPGEVTILDDGEAGFAQSGFTQQSNAQVAAAYDGDVHHMQGGSGQASWTFVGLDPDRYQVAATWAYKYNNNYNATDAPFTLSDGAGGVFSTQIVNQKLTPGEFEDAGVMWDTLDTVEVSGGTLVVTLGAGSAANKYVVADAIRVSVAPTLTVEIADAAVAESAGAAASSATVSRNGSLDADLVVSLTSDDTTEASVPATVTIPAGQASASFSIDAVDDVFFDGTQAVTFSATATGYNAGSDSLEILDDETAHTALIDDGEAGFAQSGFTYQNNAQVAAAYNGDNYNLRNGDDADQASWTFTGLDDGAYHVMATWAHKYNNNYNATDAPFEMLDAGGNVLFSVAVNQKNAPSQHEAGGFFWDTLDTVYVAGGELKVTLGASAQANKFVVADAVRIEQLVQATPTLVVQIASNSAAENAGTVSGIVSRGAETVGDLVVTLGSDDTAVGSVPATVTIPDGAGAVPFTLTVVDDAVVDDDQNVIITASATGYAGGTDSLLVEDDEFPPVQIIDNGDAGFTETGGFKERTWATAYEGDNHYMRGSDGEARWQFTDLIDGEYTVSVTWDHISDNRYNATDAPFTIRNAADEQLLAAAVDQTLSPADFSDGVTDWHTLGTVYVIDGELTVSLTEALVNKYVVADAVRIEIDTNPTSKLLVILDASSVSEAGTLNGKVIRTGDPAGSLTVNLASDNAAAATVPATITLGEGARYGTFAITPTDDSTPDGTQITTISATATGFTAGTAALDVVDDDATILFVDNGEDGFVADAGFKRRNVAGAYQNDNHSMRGGTGEASWTFTGLEEGQYFVSATWNHIYENRYNTEKAPFSITNGSGNLLSTLIVDQTQTPADFTDGGYGWEALAPVYINDGTLIVTLGASPTNHHAVADAIRIELNESLAPSLFVLVDTLSESAGASTGTVVRTGDVSSEATVGLTSSNHAAATVETSITFAIGESTKSFAVTPTDDSSPDGIQQSTVEATATGYAAGSAVLNVEDDDALEVAIMDNTDNGYTSNGFRYNANKQVSDAYGGNNESLKGGEPGEEANWTFTGLADGVYHVSATWNHQYNNNYNATDAQYSITNAGDEALATTTINQSNAPSEFLDNGIAWGTLDTVTVTGGELIVTVSGGSNQNRHTVADAVRIARVAQIGGSSMRMAEVDPFYDPLEDSLDDLASEWSAASEDEDRLVWGE